MEFTNLQNDAKYMHDQLEEAYDEANTKNNLIYSENQSQVQKYFIILASVVLAIIVILA